MKRKRGRKPGPKNALRTAVANDLPTSPASPSPEDKGSVDHTDNTPVSSEVVPEPTLSTPEKPSAASNNPADVPYVKPKVGAVYGRVKVKLKPSRVLEPHQSSSDVQTPKEVDKSDNKVPEEITETALEKDAVSSDMQTSELNGSDSDPTARKVGSIKIKSRGLSSIHDTTQDRCASTVEDPLPSKQESVLQIKESKDLLELKNLSEEKAKQLPPEHHHDETELTVALEVIKKVMKMDAAEPFNTPVDPVALGIPDYFDIIDTPMDFGTICHDLEHGNKYMNSEDVYKDVHYIWDNCTKYNSKGDYIIELMKRVKKAFMKNWLAAGLYSDIPDTGANENTNNEDALLDIQEKNHPKSKSKNKRRRQGIDRHKNDCLCAVCVVTRRRKERDENSVANENETVATNSNISEQHNMEEKTLVNNPASHDATSGGEQSPRADVYKERGEGERNKRVEMPGQLEIVLPIAADSIVNKVEDPEKCVNNQPTDLLLLDNQNEGSSQNSEEEEAGYKDLDKQERHTSTHPNGDSTSMHHQQEAPTGTSQDVKMQDYPIEQNHLVLQLCTNLFPVNQSSIFRGPHSLFHFHRHAPSQRRSPIHAAMAMIMKP